MAADAAELSSLATALIEMQRRVAAIAQRHEGSEHEDLVAALYEVERELRAAHRNLERAGRLA